MNEKVQTLVVLNILPTEIYFSQCPVLRFPMFCCVLGGPHPSRCLFSAWRATPQFVWCQKPTSGWEKHRKNPGKGGERLRESGEKTKLDSSVFRATI